MGLYQLPMGLDQADYEKAALTSNWLEFLKEKKSSCKIHRKQALLQNQRDNS